MDITKTLKDNLLTVTINGSLDSTTAAETEETIKTIWGEQFDTLKLDMTGVDYISSKGVRMAVSLYKGMQARGGKLVFEGLNPTVKEVFRLSGLSKVFGIE